MGGKMSRDKGKRGEREIVDMLQPIVDEVYAAFELDPPKLKRNTLQSDGGGSDIAGLPWLAIEVKYQEQMNITTWWKQTLEQAGSDRAPVLVYRRNNVRWAVRMFGMVGGPGLGLTAAITVDIDVFLAWFRLRLTQEVSVL